MNLLVDIGNSRLKWAIEHDGHIGEIVSVDYRCPEFLDDLRLRWRDMVQPKKMAIASVSAKPVLSGIIDLSRTLWPGLEALIPQASDYAFGVTNAYEHPEKLGVDRWLAMIGAHRHYAGAVCVADCGTAITLDVLQADGRHLGGLIGPGLIMMKQSLASNTAGLPFNTEPYPMQLAAETNVAIANGVLLAAAGLIENAMRRFAANHQLILTGGDAEIVAESLAMSLIVDKELVVKGLAAVCSGE